MNDEESVQQARDELGMTLDELKAGLDELLAASRQRLYEQDHESVAEHADVTRDVGGALWELLRRMPGVIGNSLSGDDERVATARETLVGLDGRLRDAGVDLDERFTGFADRLAGLRDEFRSPA
jgi:hypothetical protein